MLSLQKENLVFKGIFSTKDISSIRELWKLFNGDFFNYIGIATF